MNNQIEETGQRDFSGIVVAAEGILSEVFDGSVRIGDVERLSEEGRRNLLLRVVIDDAPDGAPASGIIKQVETENYDPTNTGSWDVRRFFQDWVGLEFLSTIVAEMGHGPRFYGGSREQGFVILEDMGREHRSLVEPLLEGDSASAEQALLKLVTRLGRMHADTMHKTETFEQILRTLNPNLSLKPTADQQKARLADLQAQLESLVSLEEGFWQEVKEVITKTTNPGPFYAYIHGDPCPDNVFYSDGTLRLIDFERGRLGHALLDVVYGRMMFPSCWCANRIPKALIWQTEGAYRTELAQGCPQAQEDTLFERALVEACAFWLLNTLEWQLRNALKKDGQWGISTFRPRVLARLEAFITTSEEFGHLPAMRDTAARLLAVLSKRWPDTEPLPLYPAFRDN